MASKSWSDKYLLLYDITINRGKEYSQKQQQQQQARIHEVVEILSLHKKVLSFLKPMASSAREIICNVLKWDFEILLQ